MTDTPIYDQLAREKESPVYFANGQEIGYINLDGLTFETDEDESGYDTKSWQLKTSVNHSFEFKVIEFSREASALFYGYDVVRLAETVKEWLRRPPGNDLRPFAFIPRLREPGKAMNVYFMPAGEPLDSDNWQELGMLSDDGVQFEHDHLGELRGHSLGVAIVDEVSFRFTQSRRQIIATLKWLHPGRYRFGQRPLIHKGKKP